MLNNIEKSTGYRKWNTVFFTIIFMVFLIPYISFELTGVMTMEARIVFVGMLLFTALGWIRSIILLRTVLGRSDSCKEEAVSLSKPFPAK